LSLFAGLGWAQESAEEWFQKGIEAAEARNYEMAISCFEKTIALHPDHVPSYSNIGYVYVIRNMWDEAIVVYKKVLNVNPNDVRSHHDLGFSLYKKGMFDEAIIELRKAIALDSSFASAYENLGVVYAQKGMFNEAILMFKETLRITPDDPTTHFNLGRAYKVLENEILAADHFYQAGILYLKKDNRDRAIKVYENLLPCSKEIAGVLFKKLYAHKGTPDLTPPLLPKKKDAWYVLLTRRNVRDVPAIPSKILGQLEKGVEFQIIKKAPKNTSPHTWYQIRAKSGLSGWLCENHGGGPKFKPVHKPKINTPSQ